MLITRQAAIIGGLALALSGVAQTSNRPASNAETRASDVRQVSVVVPQSGDFIAWVQAEDDRFAEDRGVTATDRKIVLPVINDTQRQRLFVADRTTNKMAVKEIPDSQVVELKTEDFKNVYRLTVRVEKDGVAVREGVLNGKVGEVERSTLLSEGDKGRVTLFNLPVGSLSLTLRTKVNGEEKTIAGPTVGIVHSPNPMAVVFEVSDAVAVVEDPDERAAAPATNNPPGAAPGPSPGYQIGQLLAGVVAIAIVVAIGWWAWKHHRAKIEDGLKALGVPGVSPEPDDTAGPDPVPPGQKRGQVQPIVLNPVPLDPAVSAPVQAPVAPAVPNPRLVTADGRVLLLSDQGVEVGRDDEWLVGVEHQSTASRKHARFERRDGGFVVMDLGSTNGTFVNGKKIDAPVTLSPGDTVHLGGVILRYEE